MRQLVRRAANPKTSTGVKLRHPVLQDAWQYRNMADMGVAVTLDDIPNIVVFDVMQIIHTETQREQKRQMRKQHNQR